MKILYLLILWLILIVLPLVVPPASAGRCGAFVVYNSGPYPYKWLPQRDFRAWSWNYPSPDAAREAAQKECLKQWEKEKPNLAPQPQNALGSGEWYCKDLIGVFCTDKTDLEGWGVVPESHNPCGALAIGDDYITWSNHRNVSHVYKAGMGPTKHEAEQAAVRNCMKKETRYASGNPVHNCRVVASVCNAQ